MPAQFTSSLLLLFTLAVRLFCSFSVLQIIFPSSKPSSNTGFSVLHLETLQWWMNIRDWFRKFNKSFWRKWVWLEITLCFTRIFKSHALSLTWHCCVLTKFKELFHFAIYLHIKFHKLWFIMSLWVTWTGLK